MNNTYLTTEQLSEKIQYNPRTIRNELVDSCLFEGIHYIKPFGRRKILFIWETIEKDMFDLMNDTISMPVALDHGVSS
jgi:hypothetical protein